MPKNQFKIGNPGGPGRPKLENTFSDIARQIMAGNEIRINFRMGENEKEIKMTADNSFHYALASALLVEGMKGNVRAAKELLDRVEGTPIQKIQLNSNRTPQTKDELIQTLQAHAEQSGITFEELCRREGLEI